jgi:negative regulator of sigma E activity
MNQDLELKLQAWVDGELPPSEAAQIARLLSTDAEAQALAGELRMTRGFLADSEPEHPLPEGRDFHWSKIRREIERVERAESPARASGGSWIAAFGRMLAPVAGVALVALVTLVSLNFFQRSEGGDPLANMVEVENPSEHIGSISYRSQSENMFVVWLYDKETEATPEAISDMPEPREDELIIQ